MKKVYKYFFMLTTALAVMMATVIHSLANWDYFGFSYENYNFTSITYPGNGYDTMVTGINNSGLILGYAYDPFPSASGFTYNNGEFISTFKNAYETWAFGINNLNQIVGCYISGHGHGFLYDGVTFTTVDVPGSLATTAYGINNLGHIVGKYNSQSPKGLGFFFDGNQFITLDVPNAIATTACDINDHGQIVGYYLMGSKYYGFLYENGIYTTIDVPDSRHTRAFGINNAGAIVGPYDLEEGGVSFLYANGEFTTIGHPEALFTFAHGINDLGTIVGYCEPLTPPSGDPQHPSGIPLPPAFILFSSGLVGLAVSRGWRMHRRR